MSNYVAFNIRREYAKAIDNAIKQDPLIPSRAEFIRRSIREKLARLEETI